MDFGTDSALAARYKSEHTEADHAIKQESLSLKQRFQEVQSRRKLLKLTISELVDKGYTPSFLVANGFIWKDLQNRFGASSLLEMGFSWEQMRNCGIDAQSACALGMDNLNINADQLMELCPKIQHLASMRLPLQSMKEKGFTMDKLTALGLNFKNMNLFNYPLETWSKQFHCNWQELGFHDYKECEQYGWSRKDLHALNVIPIKNTCKSSSTVKKANKPTKLGGWEF